MRARLAKAIEKLAPQSISISRQIYDRPELAFEENFACALLSEEISKYGFSIETPVAGLDTAFRAIHPHSVTGPVVSILAEYDALPEIGHACGHHLIAGAAWLAAAALGTLKDNLPGTLQLLGTPAEEGGAGKVKMIEAGLFANVDYAMMFHPDAVNTTGDTSLAMREVTLEFHGKEAHASSCPEKGINALDGVIASFNAINALREHMRSDARVHGIITHGGIRPNIVPGFARAQFYVRASDDAYLYELFGRVLDCARAGALSSGARLEIIEGPTAKEMRPDPELDNLFRKNMKELDVPIDERPGEMGSTDMGDVSHVCRAIHPYLAICPRGTALEFHTRQFAELAGQDFAYDAMVRAAHLLALTALDVLDASA